MSEGTSGAILELDVHGGCEKGLVGLGKAESNEMRNHHMGRKKAGRVGQKILSSAHFPSHILKWGLRSQNLTKSCVETTNHQ